MVTSCVNVCACSWLQNICQPPKPGMIWLPAGLAEGLLVECPLALPMGTWTVTSRDTDTQSALPARPLRRGLLSMLSFCGKCHYQALSEILAWGTSAGAGGGGNNTPADPWRLYQTKLLPELQAIARKHGRGLSPADVATAFHLYRKETPSPRVAGVASPGANFENEARATIGTSVAAVTVPVRVKRGGSLSARRLADAEEDRVAGRRGAELAEALDLEDLERVAAAVGEGDVSRGDAHGAAIGNRGQDLLGGGAEGREEEEGGWGGELWELGVGAEAPTIFL